MSATDNSSVQVAINVVDANSGAIIGKTTQNLNELGVAGAAAGTKLKAGLNGAGEAGTQAGAKIGAGMREAGQHSLNALDNVRLVRDDLGIRIPRAMEKVISQSKLAMGAIGALGGGLVALGAIEVLVNLGEQAYRLYQRVSDVNVEMRKFSADLGKNANQELFSNSSIETTVTLLKQVNDQIAALDKQRQDAGVGQDNSGSLMQWVNKGALLMASQHAANATQQQQLEALSAGTPTYTGRNGKERADLAEKQEILDKRLELQKRQDEVNKKEDALKHAGGGVEGRAATAAKLSATRDLDAAQQSALQANEQYLRATTLRARRMEDEQGKLPVEQRTKVYELSQNAGDAERARSDRNADLDARDTNSKQGRTERNEGRHATAEAGMSGEQGEKLYLDQKIEAHRQLDERRAQLGIVDDAYNALSRAIDTKFLNEQRKRIEDEKAQTSQIVAEAGTSGFTGLAKIDADRAEKIAALDRDRKKFADPATYNVRRGSIDTAASAEGAKQQRQFNDRIAELDAARSDRYESESDRITSSAKRSVAEISKAWTEEYGQLGALDQRRVSSFQALQNEIVKINADAAKQRNEAGQRIEDETRKLEREGGRVGMPKQQEETQAILDAYADRYQRLEELRQQDAANAGQVPPPGDRRGGDQERQAAGPAARDARQARRYARRHVDAPAGRAEEAGRGAGVEGGRQLHPEARAAAARHDGHGRQAGRQPLRPAGKLDGRGRLRASESAARRRRDARHGAPVRPGIRPAHRHTARR